MQIKGSLSGPDGSSGAPQTLQIHIPAGIDTGKSIRLKGKGMPGTGGGEPGDLLLKVTVGTRPGYERKGSDVYTTILFLTQPLFSAVKPPFPPFTEMLSVRSGKVCSPVPRSA